MTTAVRIGVVGLGQRGLQHLKALVRLQDEGHAQVTALCDAVPSNLDAAKLKRFVPALDADAVFRTSDFDTVLEAGRCDALFIAIPPSLHRDEVVRAARAGLHLMVEKPMSLDLVQALAMQDAIEAAGVLSCCGFQQRFDPRHEAVHRYVQNRRVVLATYAFHAALERHDAKHADTARHGGPRNRVWTASRAWSGTTVVEGGIHPLDLWRYWCGDVDWVQAAYVPRAEEDVVDQADNPYAYSVQFGFANGAVGNLVLSRLRRVYNLLADHRIFCTESQIEVQPDTVTAFRYEGPYPPSTEPDREAVARTLWSGDAAEGTYEFGKAFVRAIAEGDASLIRSPFRDGMNSLAAVLAANESHARNGTRIQLADWLAAVTPSGFD